ncbi:MAG: ParB/RepB/Spo0J family partition protein [Beijerinckiaceae bacterium]|nr:ParB/RepB/Spo0J family partition protein [Beijerinckiaceae bacterium]
MTIQNICLSQLVPSKSNPRWTFDANAIEGLAASIRTDGLLQNLVVSPANGTGKRYAIISGERRYRALRLLEERGELPDGFTVPVEIRERLTKDESLRLSTVENLQRADLTPLEQTEALTKLVHKGVTLEEVAAQTGLSPRAIKRRLALNGLCAEAKAALSAGEITLAQAEALTLGGDDMQRRILEEIGRGYEACSAADIKAMLLDDRPTVALAIFPLELYTGTITTDLFAESETSYFDDAEQFFELQRQAVEALANHHRAVATWVEVTENYRLADWQYREAEEGETGGVLINLSPRGSVEIREGLMKRGIDEDTATETAENPIAPKSPKASYAAPLRRYVAHHKSVAVGELLLASPRKAKEVAAVLAILNFDPHEALPALAREPDRQSSYSVLERQARLYALKLGFSLAGDDEHGWKAFPPRFVDAPAIYEAVKKFSDHELDELHTLLAALSFGQQSCDRLDCSNSLFNRVAQDLNADMKNHWRPGRAFLARRTREQLVALANESGFAEGRSCLATYKKSELVDGLLVHFEGARLASDPLPAQRQALAWLPEIMRFPAVDPDAGQDVKAERDAA